MVGAQRFGRFSQEAPYVFADLSKNRIDAATEALLFDLARQSGVLEHRDAMFAGEVINTSEQRAVLHTALRGTPGAGPAVFGREWEAIVLAELNLRLQPIVGMMEAWGASLHTTQ